MNSKLERVSKRGAGNIPFPSRLMSSAPSGEGVTELWGAKSTKFVVLPVLRNLAPLFHRPSLFFRQTRANSDAPFR